MEFLSASDYFRGSNNCFCFNSRLLYCRCCFLSCSFHAGSCIAGSAIAGSWGAISEDWFIYYLNFWFRGNYWSCFKLELPQRLGSQPRQFQQELQLLLVSITSAVSTGTSTVGWLQHGVLQLGQLRQVEFQLLEQLQWEQFRQG